MPEMYRSGISAATKTAFINRLSFGVTLMKKALLFSAALLATAVAAPGAHAQTNTYSENTISPLSGVYAGAFGGYSWNETDVAGTATDLSVDGGDYGIFLGYQIDTLLDRTIGLGINGAIEAHYAWSDAEDEVGGVTIEKDHEWGVSFRPGLSFVDNVMPLGMKPYGIIGYKRANFEASAGGLSDDEDFDGFELGIGTELIAYNDFGIRVDYSHTWYEDKSGFDPSGDDLRLGVAYHF